MPMNVLGLPLAIEALSDTKRQEVVAAMAIESLRGPTTMHGLDPGGGGEQLADFKLLDARGDDVGRMEVTTTTRSERAGFASANRKLDWSFSGLQWLWTIKVKPGASLKALHDGIEAPLSSLEADEPSGEWLPSAPGLGPGEPGSLPVDLAALGVLAVCAVSPQPSGQAGWVAVHADLGSGWYSLDAVSWEAQAAVDDKGNQKKLSVAGMTHSELFVWLDVGDGQAALGSLTRPPFMETLESLPPLSLSTGMTGVWVASGIAAWPKPISALLFFDGTSWALVEPPTLDFDDENLAARLERLIL